MKEKETNPFEGLTSQEVKDLKRLAARERLSSLRNRAWSLITTIGKNGCAIEALALGRRPLSAPSLLNFPDSKEFTKAMRSTEELPALANELLEVLQTIASIHETMKGGKL